jgi:hypothetical protein
MWRFPAGKNILSEKIDNPFKTSGASVVAADDGAG